MKLIASPDATLDEQLKLIYDCLTTGLPTFVYSGLRIDYSDADYTEARASLTRTMSESEICIEDVQREMVRMGFDLRFFDTEDDDKIVGTLNLTTLAKNWDKLRPQDLVDYISENWDADTADHLMQCILFGEIVYG